MTIPSTAPAPSASTTSRTSAASSSTTTGARPRRRRGHRLHQGQSVPSWPVRVLKGALLVAICAMVLVPFVGVIATSLAPSDQVIRNGGFVMLPDRIDLTSYRTILSGGLVTRALLVSVGVTAVGTTLSLVATALIAYALARPALPLRRPVLVMILLSMLFTPGMIPVYLTVKQAGLLGSLWSLVIPSLVSAFNIVVMRSFFMALPQELFEAATIDGASELRLFTQIVLPLSKAIVAVIGLFYAVGYWNAFFNAMLYLNDTAQWPLQLVLRTYVVQQTPLNQADLAVDQLPAQPSMQMAVLVISIVPILLVYPLIQRHFTKGVLIGAVKG